MATSGVEPASSEAMGAHAGFASASASGWAAARFPSEAVPPSKSGPGGASGAGGELGTEALGRFPPLPLETRTGPPDGLRVVYHDAEMSSRPYCVARVGPLLGSPTAVLLLQPEEVRPSALDRLADLFRVGHRGQCFADLAAGLREAGQDEHAIRAEWEQCEAGVQRELMGGIAARGCPSPGWG